MAKEENRISKFRWKTLIFKTRSVADVAVKKIPSDFENVFDSRQQNLPLHLLHDVEKILKLFEKRRTEN